MEKFKKDGIYFADNTEDALNMLYKAYKNDPICKTCPLDGVKLKKIHDDWYECPSCHFGYSKKDILYQYLADGFFGTWIYYDDNY